MTEITSAGDSNYYPSEELSLFALGTILIRNRWRIAGWAVLFGLLALLPVLSRPAVYTASASFIPQGTDASRSGLSSLAGQLGVVLPAADQTQTPNFYARVLKSRVVLEPIVRDTLSVRELGGQPRRFLDLFEIKGGTERRREEQGVAFLRNLVDASVAKTIGAVEVSATTKWPSVSLSIVTALVNGVNDYNQRTRQGQAAAERKFVEGRLTVASADLRVAEDRMEDFLKTNRQWQNSPQLQFDHDRMQRDLLLKQQVFTTLTQAYEDVRIREVRDTPVITVLEPPSVPTVPDSRGRIRAVTFGVMFGLLVGIVIAFVSEALARRRKEGNPDALEFVGTLRDMRGEMSNRMSWLRGKVGRAARG